MLTLKEKIIKDEAIQKLKIEGDNSCREMGHVNADNILCEVLISLGYKDVITEYHKIKKWFA